LLTHNLGSALQAHREGPCGCAADTSWRVERARHPAVGAMPITLGSSNQRDRLPGPHVRPNGLVVG